MQITREWLDQISDELGLTKGQQHLLAFWCKEHPYVDKEIPDQVANFLEHCRGYRKIPQTVKDFKGWVLLTTKERHEIPQEACSH